MVSAILPLVLIAVVLAVLVHSSLGEAGWQWLFLIGGLSVPLAALQTLRPLGAGGLGLSPFVLPALAVLCGPSAAAWSAFAGLAWLASVPPDWLGARPERRGPVRLGSIAAGQAAAVLAGATVLVSEAAAWERYVFSAVALAAVAFSAQLVLALAQGGDWKGALQPALVRDVTVWGLGLTLLPAAQRLTTATFFPWLAGLAFLALAISVQSRGRARLRRQVEELVLVGGLSRLAPTDEGRVVARQIFEVLSRSLEYDFAEVTFGEGDAVQTFWSPANGPVLSGNAEPPDMPPPRAGIHRRGTWITKEHELQRAGRRFGRLKLWQDARARRPADMLEPTVSALAALLERVALDREARRDPLTGLWRRHVFDQHLRTAFRFAQDGGPAVAVALLDIDHFKKINDRHGHATGDRALELLGATLAQLEGRVLTSRYGGEEFALLATGVSASELLVLVDGVRRSVGTRPVTLESGEIFLTLSAGVATFPELVVREGSELLELADAALYVAKEQGRNRCFAAAGRGRYIAADGQQYGEDRPLKMPTL